MSYFHVIARTKVDATFRTLFADLSSAELKKRFVTPYERGRSFFSGNDLVNPFDVRLLQIVRTHGPEEEERRELNRADRSKIDELNRSSSHAVFLSLGIGYDPQDIAEAGDDVTHEIIKGPPGYRSATLTRTAVVWIAGVMATVLSAGLGKWLGWV